jgi:hypothetical protein
MSGLTELERELLTALKDAHPFINADSVRRRIGSAIARAEAKAKEPQCKCSLNAYADAMPPCTNYTQGGMGWCDTRIGEGFCAHDAACHSPSAHAGKEG